MLRKSNLIDSNTFNSEQIFHHSCSFQFVVAFGKHWFRRRHNEDVASWTFTNELEQMSSMHLHWEWLNSNENPRKWTEIIEIFCSGPNVLESVRLIFRRGDGVIQFNVAFINQMVRYAKIYPPHTQY